MVRENMYKHSLPQRTIGAFLMLLPHDERFLSCCRSSSKDPETLQVCTHETTLFFYYLSCLLHSQVYKSSILSLNLFLFSFWLDTNFEVSGPFCAQHGICGQREISAGEGPGRRRGRRRRMINKFQKRDCDGGSQLRFLVKRKLGSRLE